MLTNNIGYVNLIDSRKIEEPKIKEDKELKKVTEEFESIFLKMMIDSMDKTINRENNPFFGGKSEEIFRDMLNQERASSMSKSGGIGLAEVLYRQLSDKIK